MQSRLRSFSSYVYVYILDYRKAFDSVSHTKLIETLLLLNVDPSLCGLLTG